MRIPELRWPKREGTYDDDLLLDIEAGVIAYLYRGRNAWHSVWAQHWFRNANLFSDVESAELGAEQLRERGNVFYVREVPALLLRGSHESIVVCDINTDIPFSQFTGIGTEAVETADGPWIDGLYPGVSLRDAVDAFDPVTGRWRGSQKGEGSVLTGIVSADYTFAQREGELRSLTSYPQGSGNLLGWAADHRPRTISASGSEELVSAWTELADRAVERTAAGRTRSEAFLEYRDEVLAAEPRSQWLARISADLKAARDVWQESSDELHEARMRKMGLRTAVLDAEHELEAAKRACLHPADSSAGVRAQRERVATAEKSLDDLRQRLTDAQAEEELRQQAEEELRKNTFWSRPVDPFA